MVKLSEAKWYDHIRFVFSFLLLIFSAVVTFYAILMQLTHFWDTVPGWAALTLFIVDLFILGVVEGLQIALVELKKQNPDSYKELHPRAYYLGQRAAEGDNTERFLMGRQVFVVVLVFFSANLTTITLEDGDDFLFPAPRWFQAAFLETGFLACIVVVIVAQLMPQIVAALYPVQFLDLLVMRPGYWACIAVEVTGITHFCWILSYLFGRCLGITDGITDDKDVKVTTEDAEKSLKTVEETISGAFGGYENPAMCMDGVKGQVIGDPIKQEAETAVEVMRKIEAGISPETQRVVRYYLDKHPEQFQQFPSVVGGKMYPSPQAMAATLTQQGLPIPAFLTDISHPDHVPPHVIAVQLLQENRRLQEEINRLNVTIYSTRV